MGVLGRLFGARRNGNIEQEILNAYHNQPGKLVYTNIYFDAAEAYARQHNAIKVNGGDLIGTFYTIVLVINGERITASLFRNRDNGTLQISAAG